jgi:cellulose biosynthesis protein BcsQ
VEGIESLMQTVELIRDANENLKHKFFITKFDSRIKKFKEIEEQLRDALEDNILTTRIRVDNSIRNAQNDYKTIWEVKDCKSAEDYRSLVEEVTNG